MATIYMSNKKQLRGAIERVNSTECRGMYINWLNSYLLLLYKVSL